MSSPDSALCIVCAEIPWRTPWGERITEQDFLHAYTRLIAIAGTRFQWADASGLPVKGDREYWPYILNNSTDCEFCQFAIDSVRYPSYQPTYHGGFKLKKKNFYGEAWQNKPVWTQLIGRLNTRPIVRLWIGDGRPEHFIRAIEPHTTFDSTEARDWPHVIHENPLHTDVRRQIVSWLDTCDNDHSPCPRYHGLNAMLPTRILDLTGLPEYDQSCAGDLDWHNKFRGKSLQLKQAQQDERGRYIALSYCWGTSLPCKTTTDNLDARLESIDFTSLPKTLQDSILITRVLGMDYIWIDCLCIIQDDKDDWERESACMASIYSNSYLTIAASSATHCHEGILGQRKRPSTKLMILKDSNGPYSFYFQQEPRGLQAQDNFIQGMEPLQRRAWVFQERILAPRTLHFASDQLFWECDNGLASEDGWGSFDPRDSSFEHSLPHIADELIKGTYRRLSATKWATLVSSYMSLNITYGTDRLPALAGIITTLQELTDDVCYAGLWKRHFLSGLLWSIDHATRPDTYRAPSWSFAALDGSMSYFVDLRWADETPHYVAKFDECQLYPLRNNELGELKGGLAKITGPITSLEESPQYQYASRTEYWNCMIRMGDGTLREAMSRFDVEQCDGAEVLMITSNVGLLIEPADQTRQEWTRVGIVEVFVEDDEETEFQGFTASLKAGNYPPCQTVVLV